MRWESQVFEYLEILIQSWKEYLENPHVKTTWEARHVEFPGNFFPHRADSKNEELEEVSRISSLYESKKVEITEL